MPCRNFLSPEFGEKFQREVALFWRNPNFLITSPIRSAVSIALRLVTDRQTDTGPQLVPASGENGTLIILVVLKSIVAYTVRNSSSGAKNAPRLASPRQSRE